eukprot:TRINITY_DN9365_c0_g3_i1.p1 TRINITY_DN9365_c0_g3~~TRINITY_DN9365_c0_g3_i1.p1  ORF type:complete len:455 (+),score=75.50 TRINITY_DN9365_c0_g3_i1:22-1365(+)
MQNIQGQQLKSQICSGYLFGSRTRRQFVHKDNQKLLVKNYSRSIKRKHPPKFHAQTQTSTETSSSQPPQPPPKNQPPSSTPAEEGYFWDWKYDTKINYIHKGSHRTNQPAVLMIHGFGVGAFHFNRNIDKVGEDFRVWAVDLVGQGRSLPDKGGNVQDMKLSVDNWTEQLRDFVEEVVKEPVYVVGNSLGGYLAVCLSALHPELCKGVILLNATPFWGFGPNPETDVLMSRLIPYNGSLPVPRIFSWLVKTLWFRFLKQESNVKSVLGLVYADSSSVDDDLVNKIVEASNHPMAVDSFTSMIFSPRGQFSFNEMVQMIKSPICMLYGRDDPWVVPLWGQRLKRILPQADYYELTPCGHCPHHETPNSVNYVVKEWIKGVEQGQGQGQDQGQRGPLKLGDEVQIEEDRGRMISVKHIEGAPRNAFEKWDNGVNQVFNRGENQQQLVEQ